MSGTDDANRPVKNAELKSELRSMRMEFRLWLVVALIAQDFIPAQEAAMAAVQALAG